MFVYVMYIIQTVSGTYLYVLHCRDSRVRANMYARMHECTGVIHYRYYSLAHTHTNSLTH